MKTFVVILIIIAAAGAGLWILRSQHQRASVEKKQTYYCPMHPQITSDRPGECPVCYMKLIEKTPSVSSGHDGHDHAPQTEASFVPGHASVHLDQAQKDIIGLRTARVQRRSAATVIRTVGVVAHDPELYRLQAEYLSALKTFRDLGNRGGSEAAVESARSLMEAAHLHLRHSGFSEEMIADLEAEGSADHSLFFNHGGQVWIYAPIYESELSSVRVGDKAAVDVIALTGKFLKGVVRSLDPMIDSATRSIRARIQVDDPQAVLKPDMSVNVEIASAVREFLAVPSSAVMMTGRRNLLFVEDSDGTFQPREAAIGAVSEDWTEILEGASEGERVVVDGNFLIDSESRLKFTLDEASEADPHAAHGR